MKNFIPKLLCAWIFVVCFASCTDIKTSSPDKGSAAEESLAPANAGTPIADPGPSGTLNPDPSSSDGLKCTLNAEEHGDYPPHLKVEADLNDDGIKDLFYFAGEEDVFQTCIYLGEKTKSGLNLILKHEHGSFYDSVLNLEGEKTVILVPESLGDDCSLDKGLNYIPNSLKPEIKEFYQRATRGLDQFVITYNMPDFFPIHNLFLLNKVRIFHFQGQSKVDVTSANKSYLNLKKKVLTEVLKNKSIPAECQRQLKGTLATF